MPDFSQPQKPMPFSLNDPDLNTLPAYQREAAIALAEDNAKPRFQGRLGDFVVTPGQITHEVVCPPAGAEELYSVAVRTVLGDRVSMGPCSVQGGLDDGTTVIRSYYRGQVTVPFEAPQERLQLLAVGGHPAIAETPASSVSPARLLVIERSPADEAPGIILELMVLSYAGGLDKAVQLAEALVSN